MKYQNTGIKELTLKSSGEIKKRKKLNAKDQGSECLELLNTNTENWRLKELKG